MTLVYGDLETYSACDLRTAGTHRYAEDGSTEIIVAQWAIDDGEPVVWDCTAKGVPAEFVALLQDPSNTIVFHNSHFDRTLLRHIWGIDVPIEHWRDTMVKALAHGLPGALEKIGAVLDVAADEAKDRRGKQLIQMFCKPRPVSGKRYTRETHPAEWAEFLEYSRQDIIAMRAIDQRLPNWNYREGHPELALWHLDQRINDRGFAADLDLARAAITAVATEQKRLKTEVQDATDGLVGSASQRDQMLAYILAEHGVDLPDLRADTLRRRLEDPDLPDAVKILLAIRLEATKTSTAKYKALVNAASSDGRMRNTLQFAGAQRTARWAGRIVQPQNFPRPDMDQGEIDLGIDALKAGVADVVFPGDVMRLTANAVRGCIVAPRQRKLVVADLSNIEGRGLAYLAGEAWKVQAFRDFDAGVGADLYKLAYARSFAADPATVTKGQRQIGKVQDLGLGNEGGVGAFLTFAAVYQMDLEEMADAVHTSASEEVIEAARGMYACTVRNKRSTFGLTEHVYVACEALKAMWRAAHPNVTALWAGLADAVRSAVVHPGETYEVRGIKVRRDGAWLRVRLPSGRYLCYLHPRVDEGGQISYMGINQYTRQWGRIKTYGGKLVENLVQAWARDILAANMQAIEDAGYQIVLTVHDEIITECPDDPAYSAEALGALMSRAPAWAHDCPLAAAGFETYRYRKD